MLDPMVFVPARSALVTHVAVRLEPDTSATALQPAIGVVVPLKVVVKLTVPAGTIPVFGVTVAVKVTGPSTDEEAPEVVRTKTGVPVFTVSVTAVALAVLKLASLAMLAPTEFEPAFNAVVVQVAVPPDSETALHPEIVVVLPFRVVVKATLPVGVMPLFGVTVAVKVTEPFKAEVPVPEAERVTDGVPLLTVSVIAVAVPVLKLVALASVAPMEFVPAFSDVVTQVATPLTIETVPHPEIVVVLPLSVVVKFTVPLGTMPLFGVTVAVRVT